MVEMADLKSVQCGFDSHFRYSVFSFLNQLKKFMANLPHKDIGTLKLYKKCYLFIITSLKWFQMLYQYVFVFWNVCFSAFKSLSASAYYYGSVFHSSISNLLNRLYRYYNLSSAWIGYQSIHQPRLFAAAPFLLFYSIRTGDVVLSTNCFGYYVHIDLALPPLASPNYEPFPQESFIWRGLVKSFWSSFQVNHALVAKDFEASQALEGLQATHDMVLTQKDAAFAAVLEGLKATHALELVQKNAEFNDLSATLAESTQIIAQARERLAHTAGWNSTYINALEANVPYFSVRK